MKFVHLIQFYLFLASCNCAAVSTTASVTLTKDEELVPLELPAGYEEKMKVLLPELLNRLGIPSSMVPYFDDLLSSSVSKLSNGIGYFTSWTNSDQDAACKSKLVEDQLKVTKYGMIMCKKQCLDKSKERVTLIRSTLETMYANEDRIEADIEVETKKKTYECVFNGQRYECLCMNNEIITVTPSLQSLIFQLFQGGDKRRDLIPDHTVGKILTLILLFLAEKSIEAVAAPVILPLKFIYHVYHFLKWVT